MSDIGTDTNRPNIRDRRDRGLSEEEALEQGLEESMDASDPPSQTRKGDEGEPHPSSGFTKDDEKAADKASK